MKTAVLSQMRCFIIIWVQRAEIIGCALGDTIL